MAPILAHCGADWLYCDGATLLGVVLLLFLVWWSVNRSQRRARERRR